MKSLKVKAGLLPSIIHLPASKSYANRALILAALKAEPITLKNLPKASDVTFLMSALKRIGINVDDDHGKVIIQNSFPACELNDGCTIEIGEGGTTARFLASLLLLGSKSYTLILGNRLKDRPWNEFIKLVQQLGGKAELLNNKLNLQGPLQLPAKIEIDCSKTTQFASGFQLALAYTGTEVVPLNLAASKSYWEMSKVMIESLNKNSEFSIPLDWSSASYPLAFGALKQNIFFPGLKNDPYQADAKFLSILKQINVIQETPGGIKVKPCTIKKDFKLEVSDCLDLVPALAFFLSHIEGTHFLTGIKNLVYKESDRLQEIIKLLEEFGLKASTDGLVLQIEGSSSLQGIAADLQLPNDHRMVMTGALFLRYHQGGSITPASAVDKSYPDFFSLLSV